MKKNGFTLVELMIVVVIIGILAGVSMPRFQSAADKAKAAEAPQILTSIAGAQEAYRISKGKYLPLDYNSQLNNWKLLGLNVPEKKYFEYTADTFPRVEATNPNDLLSRDTLYFTATAKLIRSTSTAKAGETITIDQFGEKIASSGLILLIPSFGAKAY
jgi:prepilin-type N-terminal cleavage/methylation domain-containing protein